MAGLRVQFGRPEGVQNLNAKVSAALTMALAETVIERVQDRVRHPAAQTLKAVAVNQYASRISSTRGGPGPIYPVRARALRFNWRGKVWFAKRVDGAGFLPLILAEGSRLGGQDAVKITQKIQL